MQVIDLDTGNIQSDGAEPEETQVIDLNTGALKSTKPEVKAVPLQPQNTTEQPQTPQQEPSLSIAQGFNNISPAFAGVGEVVAQSAGGIAGMIAAGYNTALNLVTGETLDEQGPKVKSILNAANYETQTKSADNIKSVLNSVSRASMTFPSMLYSSIGATKNFLTGEEKDTILARAEMDREAFTRDPFQTLGEDARDATGSGDVGTAVSSGLFAMSMMLGFNSPSQISALGKASTAKKASKIKEFQMQIINNQLDPTSELNPTTRLMQYNPSTKKIENISAWQLANEDFTPVQRAELGAFISKNPNAQAAIKAGLSEPNVALYGGLSPTDSRAALKMVDIVKKSKKSPLFAGKNRTTDIVGQGIVERYRFLKAKNLTAGNKLRRVIKSEAGTPVSFDTAISKFQRDLGEDGIVISQTEEGIGIDYRNSAIGESPEAKKLVDGIVRRLASRGGQTLQEGHFLKKYIDENSGLQKVSEGLTPNAKRIIGNLRRNVNESLREASPNYKDANQTFSDTIEVINDLQKIAGNSIDLSGANSRSSLGTAFRGMLSNRQSRQAQVDLIGKMDKISGKYGATFNDSIYNQMIVASQLEKSFGLAPVNSFQGQTRAGVGGGILDMTVDPTMASARVGAGLLDKVLSKSKSKTEQQAIDAIEKMLKEQQ